MLIKPIVKYLLFSIMLFSTARSFSQDALLDSLPTTKEGFIKSEPAVLNTINWLENTPLDQETQKRKEQNATLLAWVINSPTVTITFNSKLTPFTDKNKDLLIIFMGGWIKYTLQNAYSNDSVKCNLAGIRSAIKVYQMGNGIKKDKAMEKLIDLDSKNQLEAWVITQLSQK
jgi:hypothetical protein